ncbi:bifunctional metallophosphatase/5'-nucleotidase [Arundinibacter roseus]|uniref:Bifunctional metallophosphatase/5'-nucleotidase n=1 Tax=Arundinibacter roseus TaxID=2070510 RepID=A0A4R4KAP2_9BACT|nr:5'-nucleotidase C-terminal domain-containing protein [Arundinibacter roseus]TDB63772.1 bifunctional metallophosphatase/5'-nucleotidase [Arundinibacter roseus]
MKKLYSQRRNALPAMPCFSSSWISQVSLVLFLLLFSACHSGRTITFLQINDVYEISPLNNGQSGGMARVAHINKELKKKSPESTFFVLAGDFISPSVIGTLRYQSERIQGKQMVEVLNEAGLDVATFGNHEFDYDDQAPTVLQKRINESDFEWVIANMQQQNGLNTAPFTKNATPLPPSLVLTNGQIRIGLFGVCIPVNKDFVQVTDPFDAAGRAYEDLRNRSDAVVALTHLAAADDQRLAEQLPGLALIMGGHDHENMRVMVGKVPVVKADANAKTVYIHNLRFDRKNQLIKVDSELKVIDSSIPEDPETAAVVTKWQQIASKSFKELGFEPNEIVFTTTEPWDGHEATVRREHGALTSTIAKSMLRAFPESDLALFNGGSVRIDDVLTGAITQYDIVRILPFGGGISQATFTGDFLHKVLETGRLSRGRGAFLHHANARYDDAQKQWFVGEQPLDKQKTYRVVLPDFLLTGKEFGMSFLVPENDGIIKPILTPAKGDARSDVRKVFIEYLRTL